MKRWTRFLLLFLLTAALCCISALAAGEKGIYGVEGTSVVITPQTADGTAIAETTKVDDKALYADAERVGVTVSGTNSGEQYLILVTSGTDVPNVNNIVYIDQQAGNDAGLTFSAYPSSLSTGTYSVWLTSTNAGIKSGAAGTFQYYASYKLGYVDADDRITATDAQWALQFSVGNREPTSSQFLAANVDGDQRITATDAQWILQAAVGNRVL